VEVLVEYQEILGYDNQIMMYVKFGQLELYGAPISAFSLHTATLCFR
jgi:hypothetical protein